VSGQLRRDPRREHYAPLSWYLRCLLSGRAVPPVGSGSRADDHRRRWSIYGLTFWELIGGKPSHW